MRNLLLEQLDDRAADAHRPAQGALAWWRACSTATSTASPSSATTPAPAPRASSPTPTSPTPSPGSGSNGARASEGLLNAHVVAEYGVPVVLVTGDDLTCEDADGLRARGAASVAVKDYVSRYAAVCRTPARTAADIRAAAKEAAALAVRHEPVRGGPFTVELEFDAEHLAAAATVVPGVERQRRAPGRLHQRDHVRGHPHASRRSRRSSRPRWRSSMADVTRPAGTSTAGARRGR